MNLEQLTTLSLTVGDHIAHIQLCRPAQLNTMTPEFWRELPALVKYIDDGALARVIVISSQGKHFSAGMERSVFMGMAPLLDGDPGRAGERIRHLVLELQNSFTALEHCRIPVLVAIQGGCIGGAVDMVCAADIRYCTEDAYFSIKETALGMTADVGTLQRLPSLLPQGLARELAFTARKLPASEAEKNGFVNAVFENQEQMLSAVMAVAKQIASHSPLAVTGCKHMLNFSRDHSVAESLNYMATWQAGMFKMPDVLAALKADMQKQSPQFDNLYPKQSHL